MNNSLAILLFLIVIIILLIIAFIITTLVLVKKLGNKNNSFDINKVIDELRENLNKSALDNIERNQNIKQEILHKLSQDRSDDLLKAQESFNLLNNMVVKLEASQNELRETQKDIIQLKDIFQSPKARGNIGEFTLDSILEAVFGSNPNLYVRQYKLSNDKIVDAIVRAPEPIGIVCIDSKFPLTNYTLYVSSKNELEKEKYLKDFTNDVKKHIKDISEKYIIKNETSEVAIMFIPSEIIFTFIVNETNIATTYAINHKVQLASPTTLITTLTSINALRMNIEQGKFAYQIRERLLSLKEEFTRFNHRYTTLEAQFNKTYDAFKEINTTQKKISTNFEKIEQIENFQEREAIGNDNNI